jgi:hypothetical protein
LRCCILLKMFSLEAEVFMKYAKYAVLLLALTLLVPYGGFAGGKNECTVVLSDTTMVGTTQLKAGTYKIQWTGEASSLTVNFLEKGKTVATAPGKMVEKEKPSSYFQIAMIKDGEMKRIKEIDFAGKKEALVLESSQTAVK